MDPLLQNESYQERICALGGFAARVRTGWYGYGKQIRAGSVSTAISAVGKTCALANGTNPTKQVGSEKLAPKLQQMMDGWRKEDPATTKMLPVEADVPEAIATLGQQPGATELIKAVGDLALIAFYFLLRVGEYTTKATRNNSKQTEEFEMEDITFFQLNALNQKRQLSRKATDAQIMSA